MTRRGSADLRLTAAAAGATVLAALPMWPVFTDRVWFGAVVETVLVAAVVGAVGRRLALHRLVVMLAQLAGLAVLVTVRFAPDHALLGFIPTTTTWHELVDLASRGSTAINVQTVPVVDVPGIVLLVMVGVGVAAVEVDFTAVALRNAALSGLILLAVYLVPVFVLPDGATWPWFAVAASGWLLLLYVGRLEAVRAWGSVVDPAERPRGAASAATDPRAALAGRIALVALVGAVVAAGVLPGIGEGVVGRLGPRLGGDDGTGTASIRLNLTATLQSSLRSSDNVTLLTYKAGDLSPQYLRLAVLNTLDGVRWTPPRVRLDGPSVASGIQSLAGVDLSTTPAPDLRTNITATGRAKDLAYLPMPYTGVLVEGVAPSWQWDESTATVFSRSDRLENLSYTVTSRTVTPTATMLAARATSSTVQDSERIVPPTVPDDVRSLAVSVTTGATTDYARAVSLQAWFRNNFTYDLNTPIADNPDAINAFLASKRGFCQQFATTFALMARTLGMPARVAVGFTPGTPGPNGSYTVHSHDFHAWPEVWFDGAGWVRFEPTPRGDGSSVTVPPWSVAGPLATPPASQPSSIATPSSSASTPAQPNRQPLGQGAPASATSSLRAAARDVGKVALVVLVLFLAAGPGVARALRRRRRLSSPATAAGVEAAWAELGDTAVDLGLDWSGQDTPRRTADGLVRQAGLEGQAAVAVQQLRKDVEQVRYARRDSVPDAPAANVREVRRTLLGDSTRGARLRARVYPRTVVDRLRWDRIDWSRIGRRRKR